MSRFRHLSRASPIMHLAYTSTKKTLQKMPYCCQCWPFKCFTYSGLLIVGFGVYSAFLSVRLLISNNTTFEAGGNPSSLVTRRPYSYSRNPIYLGFLLIALGTATILSSLSAFIAPMIFFLVVNTIIIPFEENRLQKNFGIEYEKYKASVRRWL